MKDIAILGGFLFVSYLIFGKPKTTEKAIIQEEEGTPIIIQQENLIK